MAKEKAQPVQPEYVQVNQVVAEGKSAVGSTFTAYLNSGAVTFVDGVATVTPAVAKELSDLGIAK